MHRIAESIFFLMMKSDRLMCLGEWIDIRLQEETTWERALSEACLWRMVGVGVRRGSDSLAYMGKSTCFIQPRAF